MQYLLILITVTHLYFFNNKNDIHPESDKQAVEILNKIFKKYSNYENLKLSFIYTQTDLESKQKEEQQGTLFIKKGVNKYKIENDELELFADNNNIYTYIKDQNEIYINKMDESFKILNPYAIINSDLNSSDYKIIFKDTQNNNSNNQQFKTIDIFPLKDSPFYKMEFIIDHKELLIKKINFHDRTGFLYEYSILKEENNLKLQESFFDFNKTKYPGAEIIDYRLLNNKGEIKIEH